MIWWVQDPARSIREQKAIEQLAASVSWLRLIGLRMPGAMLHRDADIVTATRTYPITLRYPNHFPHSPPVVTPRGVEERWSTHQYGTGGELCLEIGPNNWHPDLTGADMLRSAHKLLAEEEIHQGGGEDLRSRHKETLGQRLRSASQRLLIPASLFAGLLRIQPGEVANGKVLSLYRRDRSVQILAKLSSSAGEWSTETPPGFEGLAFSLDTRIVSIEGNVSLPKASQKETFRQSWNDFDIDLTDADYFVVVHGDFVKAYDLFSESKVTTARVILEPSSRGARLDDEHQSLKAKKVAVIGCGSLGSKVATSLARSGVEKFVLVDDDIVLSENFVRNDLDWRDIGLHKADALSDRLTFANPAVKGEVYRRRLGGQESSSTVETLLGVLSECDLLIDATADPAPFNYLCSVAKFGNKPMLWGEIFGGGFGGMVARSRPGVEPDPATMRQRILAWCRDNGREIEPSPGRYEGVETVPEIADDAEVSVLAGHASMLATDTLIARAPSAYPYPVYLIGFRAGWIFDSAFDTALSM
jgi:molybdopterin/thiamine biosynthesis adenylyltransferase/ubiquitin-protein ligase